MAAPSESVQTENVVASTSIDQEIDLAQLEADLPDTRYDPSTHPGLVYRTEQPQATALLFMSGELVCTGAQTVPAVHAAIETVVDDLGSLGLAVPDEPAVTVQNIVSSADLGHPLNLNAIAIGLGLERIEYEPEQFPGLVYRLDAPRVVVLLFGTGKLVITGAKTTADAETAVEQVHERLDELSLLE